MVPVDLAYVIFIDFLALGVLRFCFLLLSNVQFLVLVNLPPGRSHAGGISSRHSRRRYPTLVASPGGPTLFIPARLSVWLFWVGGLAVYGG